MFQKCALALIFALNLLRLAGTDHSPPGFYIDEASGAAQVICIKQTGSDMDSQKLPLSSAGLGGGYFNAPYLYGEVVWTSIFGNSVASFRSYIAFANLFLILFLFLLVRKFLGFDAAIWVALLATINPWGWINSRVAWDPPLGPVYILGALYVLYASPLKQIWREALAVLLLAITAYCYPPLRVFVALFLVFLPRISLMQKMRMGLGWGLCLLPLFIRYATDPGYSARANMLLLWNPHPMNPYHADGPFELVWDFFAQVAKHFSPDFIFVHGDHNLRHSVGTFGMWSWLDGVGVVSLFVLFIFWIKNKNRSEANDHDWFLAKLGIAGVILGVVPAAMTWESVPHALRAIACWPFICLLGGLGIYLATRAWPKFRYVALAGAACFAFFFLTDYFEEYPVRAYGWFQSSNEKLPRAYVEMAEQGNRCPTPFGTQVRHPK